MTWKNNNQNEEIGCKNENIVLVSGGKFTLSLESKILLYNLIAKPVWINNTELYESAHVSQMST